MDDLAMALRRERAVGLLGPLFVVSGATGLTWQTVWGRELHLVFGTSTLAIAVVLAAFMAGLAAGGQVASRHADGLPRPLAAYGYLELFIGVWALALPAMLDALSPLYVGAARSLELSALGRAAVQAALVTALLLPPTAAMGATLPLLARFAVRGSAGAGDRVAWLYALNTAGAVAGTWLCGFVLLPAEGLAATTAWAAAANLGLGAVAVGLDRWAGPVPPAHAGQGPRPGAARAVLGVAAATGFCGLAAEVAYFRVLGLTVGASAYAFSTMLLAFLVGIAVGGRFGGPLGDRALARGGEDAVLTTLAAVLLATAGAVVATLYGLAELPLLYLALFDLVDAEANPRSVWLVQTAVAFALMLVPATLSGVAFPVAVRAALGGRSAVAAVEAHDAEDAEDAAPAVGRAVGQVYAANTVGGVFGAALAGFFLLPWLTVRGTLLLVSAVYGLAAVTAWWGRSRSAPAGGRGLWAAAAALVAVVVARPPAWDPLWMTAGVYKYVTDFHDHTRDGLYAWAVDPYDLLFYEEGPTTVVTVARDKETGNIWLANNGKIDASSTVDMPTQVMVSLLPMAWADPADGRGSVCVVGLASGITAGAAGLPRGVERLDVVEIEPATQRAARFFERFNHGVLDDPRVRLLADDGRNHLLRAAPGAYDVIVSEPSNPWLTGVSNLFTAEFFAMGATRLVEGGVWGQWVQLYGMDTGDLRSLLATFTDAFPHVQVFAAAVDADLVLVGSHRPLPLQPGLLQRLIDEPAVKREMAEIGVHREEDLLALWLHDRDGLVKVAGEVPRNTDDNMRIEHRAPLNLYASTQGPNITLLYRDVRVPWEAVGRDPERLARLAATYVKHDDTGRAVDALVVAASGLPEDDPWRSDLLAEAESLFVGVHGDERPLTPAERRALREVFATERVRVALDSAAAVLGPAAVTP